MKSTLTISPQRKDEKYHPHTFFSGDRVSNVHLNSGIPDWRRAALAAAEAFAAAT
jgi:hypothetical protein